MIERGVVGNTYYELELNTTKRLNSIGKSIHYEWEVRGIWTIRD